MAKKHPPLKSDALYPALEALVGDGGQITLGTVGPVQNAAIAAMPAGMLAALVRRKGETLPQIVQRLDAAVVQSVLENCVINEMTIWILAAVTILFTAVLSDHVKCGPSRASAVDSRKWKQGRGVLSIALHPAKGHFWS